MKAKNQDSFRQRVFDLLDRIKYTGKTSTMELCEEYRQYYQQEVLPKTMSAYTYDYRQKLRGYKRTPGKANNFNNGAGGEVWKLKTEVKNCTEVEANRAFGCTGKYYPVYEDQVYCPYCLHKSYRDELPKYYHGNKEILKRKSFPKSPNEWKYM